MQKLTSHVASLRQTCFLPDFEGVRASFALVDARQNQATVDAVFVLLHDV